jgi:hypothetical protein
MLACPPSHGFGVFPETPMSLQQCGAEEAQRFKWIQSEKEGRDLGEHAIKLWVLQHWNGFLRHRWLEHLRGNICWIELEQDDFGLLQRAFRDSPVLDSILERLKVLKENLDIILWAQGRFSQNEMQEVLTILEALDVNSCRIQCEFDPRRRTA